MVNVRSSASVQCTVAPALCVHHERDALLERIEVDDPPTQRVLGPVGRETALPGRRQLLGQRTAAFARPVPPLLRVGVGHLDVEEQGPTGL